MNGTTICLKNLYQTIRTIDTVTVGLQKFGYFSLMTYFGFIDINQTVCREHPMLYKRSLTLTEKLRKSVKF